LLRTGILMIGVFVVEVDSDDGSDLEIIFNV